LDAASRGVYRHACPNCGGPNSEARLVAGLPCPLCLPREAASPALDGHDKIAIAEALKAAGTLDGYREIVELEREARGLIEFFERAVGSRPWGAQRTWARRLARRDSFAIIAPTGVGKTTFGLAASLYYACRGERSYIILPTTTLVIQAERKLGLMVERSGCEARVLALHSKMGRRARREALARLADGDFDILITTMAFARSKVDFLSRNFRFRLVFVDDVDAAIKSGRSVDVVLRLTGFDEEAIEAGLEILRLQREIARLQAVVQNLRARLRRAAGEGERSSLRARLEEAQRRLEEAAERLRRLERVIAERRRRAASLIVSSATGRPRGQRVRLFRVLLGFEAGGRGDLGLRNVVDSYKYPEDGDVYREAVRLVGLLGDGGLVFVPVDHGIEGAERLASLINEALAGSGFRAEAYHAKKPITILEGFQNGEINVLVGVANYYGTLVRGLDLPARVRYAIFAGVPRHKFSARIEDPHPARLLRLVSILAEVRVEDVASQARRHLAALRRIVRRLSPAALQAIAERAARGEISGPQDPAWVVAEARRFVEEALAREDVWDALKELDVAIIVEEGRRYLLVPDPATYIQASGRTSRLYAGGITKGLSVVVVDYPGLFRGLMKRVSWMTDTRWVRFEELDLERLLREIDEDRERVKRVVEGRADVPELVRTALLIVESPNKARTIARFFGQPSVRLLPGGLRAYEVTLGDLILSVAASGGHVYDLVKRVEGRDVAVVEGEVKVDSENPDVLGVIKGRRDGEQDYLPVYTSLKRCTVCGYQTVDEDISRCPRCGSTLIRNSLSIVEDLRRIAWEVDWVFIGTDPDTEGEKIGWDVALLVKPYNPNIERLEFHEVTKKAILEALRNRRSFSQGLIDAQIVRRVEDRWIGFTLSPLLWCDFWPRHYCRLLNSPISEVEIRIGGRSFRLKIGDGEAWEQESCRKGYNTNLSAGRVQTPTLGWIVERTLEARITVPVASIDVKLPEENDRVIVRLRIKGDEEEDERAAAIARRLYALRDRLAGEIAGELRVGRGVQGELQPPPPYTTDSMLADASRILGMGAPEAMRLVQDLFEWGLITYHRTDSTRVSEKGMQVARDYLYEAFGDAGARLYRPRQWGEGGAHEAIRPTRPIDAERLQLLVEEGSLEVAGELTRRHLRLYDLIFRRFIASQMVAARVVKAGLALRFWVDFEEFNVDVGERVVWIGSYPPVEGLDEARGFTLLWRYVDASESRVLASLAVEGGGSVEAKLEIKVRKQSKKPLYTHGDVVSLMKQKGIGRPSTYAKIIETLITRRYVSEVPRKEPLFLSATRRGILVYDYLTNKLAAASEEEYGALARVLSRVPELVSEERTRQLEKAMRDVEEGRRRRVDVLREIYEELEGLISLVSAAPRPPGHLKRRGAATLKSVAVEYGGWIQGFAKCLSRASQA